MVCRRSIALASVFSVLWVASCATPAPVVEEMSAAPAWVETPDTDELVRLTVVGTNDVHGWIEPHARPDGTAGGPILGGTDVFAGYLRILREKRPDGVVLLDAGDMFQGTLVANMTEGEAVILAYNLLGYDAAAVGNHEFDYGPPGDAVVATRPSEDPIGNLKRRMVEATFPFLAANVSEKETGAPPPWKARDTAIIERKGIKIGIIGMSTPKTPSVTLAQNVAGLRFAGLAETAERKARELRSRGVQVVIVTMHAGGGCNILSDPADASGCDSGGEIFEMIRALPSGLVDAVVAGHTHQYMAHFINGVPSIQSSSFGVAFGMIDLWFDKKANRIDTSRTSISKPIPLCRKVFRDTKDCRKETDAALVDATFLGEKVRPSIAVAEALKPAFRIVEKRKMEPLGPVLKTKLTRDRMRESKLGDLITDIMRADVAGVRVAATNSGGIRQDIDAGPVTYGEVFTALPFENRIVVMDLTGEELLAFLTQGMSGEHGILQVSGVRLEAITPGVAPCSGQPRILKLMFDDGTPVVPEGRYLVATNDFVATGGDGFKKVLDEVDPDRINVRNDLPPLREVVAAYMRTHPEITGPDEDAPARIKFIQPNCEAAASAAPITP